MYLRVYLDIRQAEYSHRVDILRGIPGPHNLAHIYIYIYIYFVNILYTFTTTITVSSTTSTAYHRRRRQVYYNVHKALWNKHVDWIIAH